MKKLLIALIAILALLVLGWFAVYQVKGPAIEADIQQRAQRELIANNLGWAKATADGRDVIVSGVAQDTQQQRRALALAKVRGVNQVIDRVQTGQAPAAVEVLKTDVAVTMSSDEVETSVQPSEAPVEAPLTSDAEQLPRQIPYQMQVQRDEAGLYTISGVSSGVAFQQAIEAHLQSIGADPNQTVWSLQESASEAPENWQDNVKDSISALQYLRQGSVSIADDKALVRGVASSQDASDAAESFAQRLAADYTTEMVLKTDAVAAVVPVAQTPIVGSSQYVEKFCQALLNEAVKKDSIQFESGSVQLEASAKAVLADAAQSASRCPAHRIYINGYTDSYGDANTNKALSQARAESVMAYLVSLGVQSARLEAQGYGESKPIASNKTEVGRAQNRRIELIVKGTK